MSVTIGPRLPWVFGLAVGAALGALLASASEGLAAERVEYRVVPVNEVPFGARGAAQYQALLERLSAEGWQHDHTLPGFVVFRR